MSPSPSVHRLAITVQGVVQGVGFRPFVYQIARENGLAGWVRNEADAVRIEVQGESSALDAFVAALREATPSQARIDKIDIRATPVVEVASDVMEATQAFQILASELANAPRPTIPADLAMCAECLAEIGDASQRRYNYPFTNCTQCGPRWSIIEGLPYDRPRTSMAGFAMCDECRAEYENPADRRFHAQPIACPRCGPTLQLLVAQGADPANHAGGATASFEEKTTGHAALIEAANAIVQGQIVAVKGLGGFQLLADATNAAAVERLRQRKRRPDRPFAVMMPTLDDVCVCCHVSEDERRALTSHQSPIVLLRKRVVADVAGEANVCSRISIVPGVAPDNPFLGVMLPYTPLHHLLLQAVDRPIVCTSGNLSEEPMAISTDVAKERLGSIADVLLTHNRPIVRPVDDSIVRVSADGLQILRRARGYAPLPISVVAQGPTALEKLRPIVLAMGGHLKNTIALSLGGVCGQICSAADVRELSTPVVVSSHIGDLDSVLSVEVFRRAVDDLTAFFQVAPTCVACDLHPDYASTRHAESLAMRWGVPVLRFQHHHAHVAACMAEHGLASPVLGFAWDGTGYGPDGTVWGGEALLCQGAGYRRVARLRPFGLPGGDHATREPRRSALGVLFEVFGEEAVERIAQLGEMNDSAADRDRGRSWFKADELCALTSMLARRVNAPRTSSMGRLFDAVAAICGFSPVISFEGQAAMQLEYCADAEEESAYAISLSDEPEGVSTGSALMVADWEPMIRAVLVDRMAGVPIGRISARFHNGLADMAVATAKAVAGRFFKQAGGGSASVLPVVLTGGCFQNALLNARVGHRLSLAGFTVYTHLQTPPGDGGIALGQAFLAMNQKQGSLDVSRNSG